jgi:precorrin-6Y C5,15-methyltransferase (decarboxylating)
LPDDAFAHDGQITKRRIRALTLAALAPRTGEVLWDIGAGSGSVSVEWCLAGGRSIAIEQHPDRAANIRANAAAFGVDHRLSVVEGAAPAALATLPAPQAVFIGGGGDNALLSALWHALPPGTRLVANAVTLETETLLACWHGAQGGDLIRIELSQATPLGRMRGWTAWRPVVQWSVTR